MGELGGVPRALSWEQTGPSTQCLCVIPRTKSGHQSMNAVTLPANPLFPEQEFVQQVLPAESVIEVI